MSALSLQLCRLSKQSQRHMLKAALAHQPGHSACNSVRTHARALHLMARGPAARSSVPDSSASKIAMKAPKYLAEVPRPVLALGVAGLLPFCFTSVTLLAPGADAALLDPTVLVLLRDAQFKYGVSILSFLGAVHWGLGIAHYTAPSASPSVDPGPTWERLSNGVAPSLVAYACALLYPHSPAFATAGLVGGFIAAAAYDSSCARHGLVPHWWLPFRNLLTALVVAILASSIFLANPKAHTAPSHPHH